MTNVCDWLHEAPPGPSEQQQREDRARELLDAIHSVESVLKNQLEDLRVIREELKPWGDFVRTYPITSSLLGGGLILGLSVLLKQTNETESTSEGASPEAS